MAAKNQGLQYEQQMISAIQQAYYLQAKNPSDDQVLIQLSQQIGLNSDKFIADLNSAAINQL